jgi:hypothetical protein
VTNKDIKAIATLPEVAGDEEELDEDGDNIVLVIITSQILSI